MSLDDLQAQLRGTLDQQFAALKQKYDEAIADARRQAAADAERDVAVKLERARAEFEQARTEWETQLEAVAAAARAEGEQQASEAAQREHEAHEQQLEQAVDQAVAAARRTAQLELESERRRSQNEIEAERARTKSDVDAERARAQGDLDALRQRMEAEIAAARTAVAAARTAAAAASARVVAPPTPPPGLSTAAFERVLLATREIDNARTLSQALESLLNHTGAIAGRAALFLINGDRLKSWKTAGIPDIDVQTVESSIGGKDLLARAIQTGQAIPSGPSLPAPPFARLPAERTGLAVPVMIGGRAVAVLYADSGPSNPPPAGSSDSVECLVRHASAVVALRTAMRTLDVLGGTNGDGDGHAAGSDTDLTDDQGARRYARLLVSEIKLYNEAAVRAGRQQRDLLQRLRPEIDRAQRLYEERVPPAVDARHVYFQQELVQTLADGDAALLGNA